MLFAAPLASGFLDVFQIVVGVLLSLSGLGLLFMGLISLADRRWRRGGIAAASGLGLLGLGFLLVGVL